MSTYWGVQLTAVLLAFVPDGVPAELDDILAEAAPVAPGVPNVPQMPEPKLAV